MGIDFLDMMFRLEKAFGLKIDSRSFLERVPKGPAEPASFWSFGRWVGRSSNPDWRYERREPVITAGDVHAIVCAMLAEKGMTVPPDSWPRVQNVLSDVTGRAANEITPESRLFQDLGFA